MWFHRHPSQRQFDTQFRVTGPNDPNLNWDLRDVTIGPPLVLDRDLVVPYSADTGRWQDGDKGYRVDDPSIGITGSLIYTVGRTLVPAAMFDEYVATLDMWAEKHTVLRFVAASRKLAAFYPNDNLAAFLPVPLLTP